MSDLGEEKFLELKPKLYELLYCAEVPQVLDTAAVGPAAAAKTPIKFKLRQQHGSAAIQLYQFFCQAEMKQRHNCRRGRMYANMQ